MLLQWKERSGLLPGLAYPISPIRLPSACTTPGAGSGERQEGEETPKANPWLPGENWAERWHGGWVGPAPVLGHGKSARPVSKHASEGPTVIMAKHQGCARYHAGSSLSLTLILPFRHPGSLPP